jgi:hypothetical protein
MSKKKATKKKTAKKKITKKTSKKNGATQKGRPPKNFLDKDRVAASWDNKEDLIPWPPALGDHVRVWFPTKFRGLKAEVVATSDKAKTPKIRKTAPGTVRVKVRSKALGETYMGQAKQSDVFPVKYTMAAIAAWDITAGGTPLAKAAKATKAASSTV